LPDLRQRKGAGNEKVDPSREGRGSTKGLTNYEHGGGVNPPSLKRKGRGSIAHCRLERKCSKGRSKRIVNS